MFKPNTKAGGLLCSTNMNGGKGTYVLLDFCLVLFLYSAFEYCSMYAFFFLCCFVDREYCASLASRMSAHDCFPFMYPNTHACCIRLARTVRALSHTHIRLQHTFLYYAPLFLVLFWLATNFSPTSPDLSASTTFCGCQILYALLGSAVGQSSSYYPRHFGLNQLHLLHSADGRL